jgi:hypothetical protein
MVEVKGGGILKSRRAIRLPGGRHEMLPVLHALDERDLTDAIKNCMQTLNIC